MIRMDYKNSKIYAIKSNSTDKIYIGSTTQKLSKRFSQHKSFFKKNIYHSSSFEMFLLGDCYIELVELFPCSCKEELLKKEGEIIQKYNDKIVNKKIAGRTKKEYRDLNKEYYNEKNKEFRENNKEYFKEYYKNRITSP